jgi:hypothetical protein
MGGHRSAAGKLERVRAILLNMSLMFVLFARFEWFARLPQHNEMASRSLNNSFFLSPFLHIEVIIIDFEAFTYVYI